MALQILALVGYSAFLVVTFGWRTWQAKTAGGKSSWRPPVSRIDAFGESVCLFGCILTLVAPPLALTGIVDTLDVGSPTVRAAVAALGLGFGTGIAVWAQGCLADDWRAGVEASASLVTTGPFARVRNPFYLGCFCASGAVLVAVPTVVALGGLVLHILAAELIVRGVEEPILSRAHGDEYARYKQRTGRFLPRLSARTRAADAPS